MKATEIPNWQWKIGMIDQMGHVVVHVDKFGMPWFQDSSGKYLEIYGSEPDLSHLGTAFLALDLLNVDEISFISPWLFPKNDPYTLWFGIIVTSGTTLGQATLNMAKELKTWKPNKKVKNEYRT